MQGCRKTHFTWSLGLEYAFGEFLRDAPRCTLAFAPFSNVDFVASILFRCDYFVQRLDDSHRDTLPLLISSLILRSLISSRVDIIVTH